MTAPTAPAASPVPGVEDGTDLQGASPTELVEQDLLVEDVSIDGMCGVY